VILLTDCQNPEALIVSPLWAAEEKLDGERRIMRKNGTGLSAATRTGNVVEIPEHDTALAMLSAHDWILDGEFIGGRFVAFDILELDSEPVTCANGARREILESVSPFSVVRRVTGDAKCDFVVTIRAEGGEGVVFKRIAAEYRAGRSEDCQRLKNYETDTFTVKEITPYKSSIEVEKGGLSFGRVAVGYNHLPMEGQAVRIRFDRVTEKGRLLRAKFIGLA
jgi:ATP-dependent DNA ligase